MTGNILARAADTELAVFDVDGVLTDGSLHYGPGGEETKVFNTLDGHGIKMLQAAGVIVAIISGRESKALGKRAGDLGIHHVFMGVADKGVKFQTLLDDVGLAAERCAGIGDDVVDLPFLSRCGFAVAVPEAPAYLKAQVHYVTQARAGRGAAREFCDILLHAKGKLAQLVAGYSA
ncbi:MAG: HAD hydrolase family protein [Betaproteobacteria bacterium]|nr:HAD hydrolase family protein [Betaproteobacteria bacterium]